MLLSDDVKFSFAISISCRSALSESQTQTLHGFSNPKSLLWKIERYFCTHKSALLKQLRWAYIIVKWSSARRFFCAILLGHRWRRHSIVFTNNGQLITIFNAFNDMSINLKVPRPRQSIVIFFSKQSSLRDSESLFSHYNKRLCCWWWLWGEFM